MPILLNVLGSNDQRVVEQAALCVSRIVESFKHLPSKLEELVGVDLLKAILRLLLPGSTNHLIGPNLHTQFLRVLAITADDSPRLAAELFKMNIVETLYQNLTGVSPPTAIEDIASKLDSVLIMQALIHRPREQIIETLNVICNLLPPKIEDVPRRAILGEKRLEFLNSCKEEVRRFTLIILPTLTDAYSSTVNLDVRLRVLTAQIKMLSNFDRDVILEALKFVPYASFLASILSQQDHPSLVSCALQATELLMSRLGEVYRYQLYREGVITEIERIAATSEDASTDMLRGGSGETSPTVVAKHSTANGRNSHDREPGYSERYGSEESEHTSGRGYDESSDHGQNSQYGNNDNLDELSSDASLELENDGTNDVDDQDLSRASVALSSNGDATDTDGNEGVDAENEGGVGDEVGAADDEGDISEDHADDLPGSPESSGDSITSDDPPSPRRYLANAPSRVQIGILAKEFLRKHEIENNDNAVRTKATQTLSSLTSLTDEISTFYLSRNSATASLERGVDLFKKLALFFNSDVFGGATSAELLGSGVVHTLERVFSNPDENVAIAAQTAFLECFMDCPDKPHTESSAPEASPTPFSIFVHKLQDLLSRSEHFEVITVHQNTFDGNHTSAASMLARQIRLRLVADDDSEVPLAFKSIMVSIHAIATFKTLEDYLRPRITPPSRSRNRRDGLSRALAAMAGSSASPMAAAAAARLTTQGSQLLSGSPMSPRVPVGSSDAVISSPPGVLHTAQTSPVSHHRSSRKSDRTKSIPNRNPSQMVSLTGNLSDTEGRTVPRRSSRHHVSSTGKLNSTYKPSDNTSTRALECVDESPVNKGEGELDLPNANTMDAVVGELDEDMTSDDALNSSAVNLDITASGTSGREDGTRASTTPQSASKAPRSNVSALTAALRGSSPPFSASRSPRPSPYVSMMNSGSQDWYLEFTLDGKIVPMDSTVYRAVLNSANTHDEHLGRSVWSTVHTVHYRRVLGQPPEPPKLGALGATSNDPENSSVAVGLVGTEGLDVNHEHPPITSSILRLLKTLHDLNANIDDIFVTNKETLKLNAKKPLSQFVNTKLTAKLNRQLEEPLIVASNCLPTWSEDLARLYPFLFPFETRHLFLQSTSFGYARSMARWQNAQLKEESRRDRRDDRPFLGRLQRQKVRISRSKILESAVKVMELYGASQSILEVEYFEEVGTGLGPTLEFYSSVSREFSKRKLKLWRDNDTSSSEFVSGPNGLFPRPLSEEDTIGTNGERVMSLFKALGKFVARSMLDSRIIDINFNPIFFRIGDESSGVRPSLGAVKAVDPTLARSLLLIRKYADAKKAIEGDVFRTAVEKADAISSITINNTQIDDLSLDFTLPGYPEIELVPGGSQIPVTIDNVGIYVDKVVTMTLEGGVRRQVEAFRQGFSQVFPYSALSAFTPDELVSLFGRVDEDWSLETLMDSIKADHGFNMDSRSVRNLLQVMSEMTPSERRDFLQFTTGSPRLPIGGFRSLTPMFTVVCKPSEAPYTSDDYLPSVMTCVNYLKLPDYTDIDILRKQLYTAIKEGQGSFHLS